MLGQNLTGGGKILTDSDKMSDEEQEFFDAIEGFFRECENYQDDDNAYMDEAEDFIMGNQYLMDRAEKSADPDGAWPVINHTLEIIEKQTAQITRNQTRAYIVSEDANDFAALPLEHPFMQLANQNQSIFKKKQANEIFAELLTARLDSARKKMGLDAIFDSAADCGAWYRYAHVLVRFEEGYLGQEGIEAELLNNKDVKWDRKAPGSIENGRFFAYRIRRTKKWVRENLAYEPGEEYDDSLEPEDTDYSFKEDKVEDEDKLLDIWVCFRKDQEMLEETMEHEEQEMVLMPDGNPLLDIEGQEVHRTIKTQVAVEVPKFAGGWSMGIKLKTRIVGGVQDNPSPDKKLPIKRFVWQPSPGKDSGLSVYDMNKDANQSINQSFKYALENSNRSQTKVLYKKSAIQNLEKTIENESYGFIEVDPDEPMGDAFTVVPGAPLSGSQLELASTFMSAQDKVMGATDMRIAGSSPNRLTGDAVEGLNGADADRHEKRIRRWQRFKKEVYRCIMAHILKYEDQEKTVVLGRDWGQPTYISIAPDLFDFSDWDFEARWEIEMREADDLPQNRAKRNEAKLATMKTILNLPPNRAKMALRFLNLEDEAALQVMLDEEVQQQQQTPPPPTELEIAQQQAQIQMQSAQQKAQLDIQVERETMMLKSRETAAESIAQAMEHMAKKAADVGDFQLHLAIIALIPQAVEEAMNGKMIQSNQAYQVAMNQIQGQPIQQNPVPQPIM